MLSRVVWVNKHLQLEGILEHAVLAAEVIDGGKTHNVFRDERLWPLWTMVSCNGNYEGQSCSSD